MTWQEIWFVAGAPLAGFLMIVATFIIIRLDERPTKKRKP